MLVFGSICHGAMLVQSVEPQGKNGISFADPYPRDVYMFMCLYTHVDVGLGIDVSFHVEVHVAVVHSGSFGGVETIFQNCAWWKPSKKPPNS